MLANAPVENGGILLKQSFTALMPLLTAVRAFRLFSLIVWYVPMLTYHITAGSTHFTEDIEPVIIVLAIFS